MAPRIVDKSALERCTRAYDELDGTPTNGAGPHHIITRGAGGPDHQLNLIQLCSQNHTRAHAARISKTVLFDAVAKREGWESGALVEDAVRLMMRTGKTIEELEQ